MVSVLKRVSMVNFYKLFGFFCCIATTSYTMQKEQMPNGVNPIHRITSWEQIQPFAGKIVAYQSSLFYFVVDTLKTKSYDAWSYGFISSSPKFWTEEEQGYQIKRLLHKKGVQSCCFLVNPLLQEGSFYIRTATPHEKKTILQELNDNKAKFDYMNFNEEEIRSVLTQE
jgi:hypothetical protein